MSYLPDRIYRHDRQRESAWEALDAMAPGREFTLDQLWRQRGVQGTYSMICAVVRDAVRLGLVKRLGRLPSQGGPWLLRKSPVDRSGESMTPPADWRRPTAGAR